MTDSTTRRGILAAAPALGAIAALAACSRTPDKTGPHAHLGSARTVTWAVGTTGSDFVTDVAVGCADAAEMLGWKFNRVLNTQPTPDAHINAIRQAVTARSDVIVTVDWYQAVVDEIASAKKDGVQFALVNSANNPDTLAPLNVPVIGDNPRDTGRMMGSRIAEALAAQGKNDGIVLAGNPFPGSRNVEDRLAGIADGLHEKNSAFRLVTFADSSAQDFASSVALYKAQMTQLGGVAAHAVAGGEMSALPLLQALSEQGAQPGQTLIGSWSNSLKLLTLVKDRHISFALDENLYYQGFLAVLMAWSVLERMLPAPTLPSGATWITPANADDVIASYNRRRAMAAAYGLS